MPEFSGAPVTMAVLLWPGTVAAEGSQHAHGGQRPHTAEMLSEAQPMYQLKDRGKGLTLRWPRVWIDMAQEAHSSPPVLPSRPFRGRQTDPPELPLLLPALHQNAKCSTACPDIYRAAPRGARQGCRHETLIRVIIKHLINITAAAHYCSDSNRHQQHPRAALAPELGQRGTEPKQRLGET